MSVINIYFSIFEKITPIFEIFEKSFYINHK